MIPVSSSTYTFSVSIRSVSGFAFLPLPSAEGDAGGCGNTLALGLTGVRGAEPRARSHDECRDEQDSQRREDTYKGRMLLMRHGHRWELVWSGAGEDVLGRNHGQSWAGDVAWRARRNRGRSREAGGRGVSRPWRGAGGALRGGREGPWAEGDEEMNVYARGQLDVEERESLS